MNHAIYIYIYYKFERAVWMYFAAYNITCYTQNQKYCPHFAAEMKPKVTLHMSHKYTGANAHVIWLRQAQCREIIWSNWYLQDHVYIKQFDGLGILRRDVPGCSCMLLLQTVRTQLKVWFDGQPATRVQERKTSRLKRANESSKQILSLNKNVSTVQKSCTGPLEIKMEIESIEHQ